MNKNQNINYIFLLHTIFLLLCCPYLSHSQQYEGEKKIEISQEPPQDLLFLADSLFQNQRYSEAYPLYQRIFDQGKSSPGMLLKMAFIQEGRGDFGSALYFLNLYYLQTSDKQVLAKMESTASQQELQGYRYSDFEFFAAHYYKYQTLLTLATASLVLLAFAFMLYQKRKRNKPPVVPGIFFMIVLGLLYVQVNYNDAYNKGIIINSHSYLMQSPSSGADLLEVVKQGHRVEILGKEDVWVKINWNGTPAYIRENNILKVNL